MLKEFQKSDKRYKKGLEEKVEEGLKKDCKVCTKACEDV